jgi:UDP-N-acetyl-D-glucosamine dehydrogenase
MPRYVVGKIQDALNDQGKALKGSKVLVLGVAYKPDIDDLRESPALDVIGLLRKKGADVIYHDPFVPSLRDEDTVMATVPDLMEAVNSADCVAVITSHSSYDYAAILNAAKLVVDTRNAFKAAGKNHPKVVKL